MSKTPKFDALIEPILADLKPHTRTCAWKSVIPHCEGEFEITEEDIAFLKSFQVPAPNYCPTCRRIIRFSQMGLFRLFKRPCDAPGHSEDVISIFPKECPFPVYDYVYHASDEFDAFAFGREYKSDSSPMAQLFDLRKVAPLPSFLNRESTSINSEYSSGGRNSKNCYYTSGVFNSEDIWYSGLVHKSREVMDSRSINDCTMAYEAIASDHLYKTFFSYFSKNCTDCAFLFDCRNCTDCFGCVNLRNKSYYIFNEQKTKEEYVEFMKSHTPFSYQKLLEHKETFWKLVKSLPINASRNVQANNVSGVLVENSQNLFDVTDFKNSENVRHADSAISHNDSMDILFSGGNSHHLYMTVNIGSQASNVKFSVSSKYCSDCEFIFNSKSCTNCFMCFGLQNKSYCVLNRQYTPEEYWKLVDQIKSDMLARGEYGQPFGLEFSTQAYNFSLAGLYYPISDDTVLSLGAYLALEPETNTSTMATLEASDLPDTITDIDDSILEKAILCEKTGKPFRIIKTELEFYRKYGIPVPHVHPNVRFAWMYNFLRTGVRHYTTCVHCSSDIQSIFDPKDGYLLYCEKCYQQEVV